MERIAPEYIGWDPGKTKTLCETAVHGPIDAREPFFGWMREWQDKAEIAGELYRAEKLQKFIDKWLPDATDKTRERFKSELQELP